MAGNSQVLTIEIDRSVRWDEDVFKTVKESLPYFIGGFRDANFSPSGLTLAHDSLQSEPDITKTLSELIDRISSSFRDVTEQVYVERTGTSTTVDVDPFGVLTSRGDVVSTGRGKYCYSGEFLTVFRALDDRIRQFALQLGAVEELYPTTVQTRTLLDAGYLTSFPHHAFFVAPINTSQADLADISEGSLIRNSERAEVVKRLNLPTEIMAPTVCYHCFEARKGKALRPAIITALNKCHRHEAVDVMSLSRLTTYWMREIIVIDDKDAVTRCINEIQDWTVDFLSDIGVSFRLVSASDPFFADTSAEKRVFQSALDLKREIKVPIYGGKWISCGSFNNHKSSIVDKFSIAGESGQALTSGCVGWGMERLLYGIFSHFGPTPSDWPVSARKALNL